MKLRVVEVDPVEAHARRASPVERIAPLERDPREPGPRPIGAPPTLTYQPFAALGAKP